jgi:GAF domain-containing protein
MDHRGELRARAFVHAADTLADDFDETAYLHGLCRHYVKLLDIDAAEVVRRDRNDRLHLVASSCDLRPRDRPPAPYDHDSPSRQAVMTGEQVRASDLRIAGQLWPQFVPAAIRVGYAAVHAFPMRLRTEVLGAISVFRRRPGVLIANQVTIAKALADVAAVGLVQHRARQEKALVIAQLQGALNSRVIIEQAKGILAERCGVHVDRAFEQMRSFARSRRLKLCDVALDVVRRRGDAAAVAAMVAAPRCEEADRPGWYRRGAVEAG